MVSAAIFAAGLLIGSGITALILSAMMVGRRTDDLLYSDLVETAMPCNVCGCLIYPALPTERYHRRAF